MKWALVLSGGGSRGVVYTGFLKKMKEYGLQPDFIAGTSIGAIMGGLYASGMDPEEMERFLLEDFHLSKFMSGFVYKLAKGRIGRVLMAETAVNTLLVQPGVESGERIRATLKELSGGLRIEDTPIPFLCNSCDLLTGDEIHHKQGPLSDAIYASMAYPGAFVPLHWENRYLCDGGIVNNLLLKETLQRGYRRIIVLNSSPLVPIPEKDLSTGFSVFLRALTIAPRCQCKNAKTPLFSRIESIPFNLNDNGTDFSRISEYITAGERAFDRNIDRILRVTGKGKKS